MSLPSVIRIALIACCLTACSPSAEDQVPAGELQAVEDYYRSADIGGGFNVFSLKVDGQHIVGDLSIQDSEQACSLRDAPTDRKILVFSNACPYADDSVWEKIGPNRDIKLNASCRGEAYYTHSCRAAHRKGTGSANSTGRTEIERLTEMAKSGDALSQTQLGIKFANGDGVPKDIAKSVEWYQMAAAQGHAGAQANLAMTLIDEGPLQDLVAGYAWALLASKSPNQFAASIGGKQLPDYESKLKPSDIKRATAMADNWKLGEVLGGN